MGLAAIAVMEQETDYVMSFGDVELNFDRAMVMKQGNPVPVTPSEYELLVHFLLNPERDLSRDSLLDAVWSCVTSPNTRTVDAHILRLRQKFEPDPNAPRHFLTVHKVGYRFRP